MLLVVASNVNRSSGHPPVREPNLQADRIPLPPKPEPIGTPIAGGIPSPPPKPKPMGALPADGIGAATPKRSTSKRFFRQLKNLPDGRLAIRSAEGFRKRRLFTIELCFDRLST
jgi:hypothetical protein